MRSINVIYELSFLFFFLNFFFSVLFSKTLDETTAIGDCKLQPECTCAGMCVCVGGLLSSAVITALLYMCYSCSPVWIWMDDNTGSFCLFNARITAFRLHLIRQPRDLIAKRQICFVSLKGNHQYHCVPPSATVRSSCRT